ncbi:MAG: YajQ family cyclic di-GMP-binding protein [Chloroflexi bacterium]|nr:YajQ family cyclic di-GMP-binding protein [Chloroflexota bacterium]
MAKTESFDITTGCDLQEVDNAVNQARKQLIARFDFKGVLADIEFDRAAATVSIHTTDEFKLDAIWDALVGRFVSRSVPIENMKRGDVERAGGDTIRQVVTLLQGIDDDTARKITKFIRDQKLKRVQSQIQGDAVRVSAPNRDDLQAVIRAVRGEDWDVELTFGNYR